MVCEPVALKLLPLGVRLKDTLPPSAIAKLVSDPNGISAPNLPSPKGAAPTLICSDSEITNAGNQKVLFLINYSIRYSRRRLILSQLIYRCFSYNYIQRYIVLFNRQFGNFAELEANADLAPPWLSC